MAAMGAVTRCRACLSSLPLLQVFRACCSIRVQAD
jgi:hypothetical protein